MSHVCWGVRLGVVRQVWTDLLPRVPESGPLEHVYGVRGAVLLGLFSGSYGRVLGLNCR